MVDGAIVATQFFSDGLISSAAGPICAHALKGSSTILDSFLHFCYPKAKSWELHNLECICSTSNQPWGRSVKLLEDSVATERRGNRGKGKYVLKLEFILLGPIRYQMLAAARNF